MSPTLERPLTRLDFEWIGKEIFQRMSAMSEPDVPEENRPHRDYMRGVTKTFCGQYGRAGRMRLRATKASILALFDELIPQLVMETGGSSKRFGIFTAEEVDDANLLVIAR